MQATSPESVERADHPAPRVAEKKSLIIIPLIIDCDSDVFDSLSCNVLLQVSLLSSKIEVEHCIALTLVRLLLQCCIK